MCSDCLDEYVMVPNGNGKNETVGNSNIGLISCHAKDQKIYQK